MDARPDMTAPVHEVLAAELARHQVGPVFGLVGDGNLFLVDSLVSRHGGRYVAARHEAAAVQMAIGHAQVTGTTGVATVTHGPALANTAGALIEAVKGRHPLLLIAGDTPPGDRWHLQKFDQRAFAAATGAGFIEMDTPETAAADLVRALRIATLERRPVVFNMRVDLQWSTPKALQKPGPIPEKAAVSPAPSAVEEAASILAAARRPIILAGRGACDAQARAALIRLAERVEAPLATTLKASGLFHGHRHNIGIFGGLSHSIAVDIILEADTVIAFGAGLTRHTTGNGELLRGKRVVQVLEDPAEACRHFEPLLTVFGSSDLVAEAMHGLLDEAGIPGSGHADADMAERLASATCVTGLEEHLKRRHPDRISFLEALIELNRVLPEDRTLVTDLGRFVTLAWRALPVRSPEALVNTAHFGAIGCGLHQAIGAAIGRPGRRTVLVCGDGGFALAGPAELATAVEQDLDLTVVVCNDGSYGAEHIQFSARDMDPGLSLLRNPGCAEVARAYGFEAVRVENREQLARACALAGDFRGQLLIELIADPAEVPLV